MKQHPIVIIGGGLSGLICAYTIRTHSNCPVVILEQGDNYVDRFHNSSENMMIGVGGAGTLYGGKMCLPPASGGIWNKTKADNVEFNQWYSNIVSKWFVKETKIMRPNCDEILDVNYGLWEKHFDSLLLLEDEMNCFVQNVINSVMNSGVAIRTNCRLLDFSPYIDDVIVHFTNELGNEEQITAANVVVATGRVSSTEIERWFSPDNIVQQLPDLGIRISMKRKDNYFFSQIGKDVKLKAQFNDKCVRTFCVCSGGHATKVQLNQVQYYDGHFGKEITDTINLGILVRSHHHVGPQAAIRYCEKLSPYIDSDISLEDIMQNSRLLKGFGEYHDVVETIRDFVNLLQDKGIIVSPFNQISVMLPSVDHLNPVVVTDSRFESNIPGVFVIGDAAGISRGFVQSMWSGYCAGSAIASQVNNYYSLSQSVIRHG